MFSLFEYEGNFYLVKKKEKNECNFLVFGIIIVKGKLNRMKMEKSKNLNRNVFLTIGIIVGLMIFLWGSQLNANLSHAQKHDFKNERLKESNPIIKIFSS
jgi:hypothetical protein